MDGTQDFPELGPMGPFDLVAMDFESIRVLSTERGISFLGCHVAVVVVSRRDNSPPLLLERSRRQSSTLSVSQVMAVPANPSGPM